MAAPATLRLSPKYGRRLDIQNCSLDQIRACTEFETSRTRIRMALVVVSGAVAALAIAFLPLGLSAGTMAYVGPMWGLCGAYVRHEWGVAAPIAAGTAAFYFRRDTRE